MLNKPTVAELMAQGNNRYTLVIATAKRARQIAKDREDKIKKQEPLPEFDEDNISPITAKARHLEEIKMQSLASTVEQETKQEEVKEDSEEN